MRPRIALGALTLTIAAAAPGCLIDITSPRGEARKPPIEIDYRISNTVQGLCHLTPLLIANSAVALEEVTLIEYGRTTFKGGSASYWGRERVVPGDTLTGSTVRTYAGGGPVIIWTHYRQDGERKAKMRNMWCA